MTSVKMAPWPHYEQDEIDAVAEVLRSGKVNYWTGTQGREFEREFAESTGIKHAVFVANGTLALELALRALDLPPGSEVITTPHTFIATASAIVAVGLRPVFADIDPDSGNITPETIAAAITPRTSAVIVVHLGGWPARMPEIQELCRSHGLRLIEDCAQAHGAMIGDRHVGTFSDIAAWSFCQDKIITTGGEGGMVGTDDEALWRRMWSYKDHGKSWEAVYERDHPPGFRWLHDDFGSNWRATEMQAAMSENVPTCRSPIMAPWACAQSSTSLRLRFRQSSWISGIRAGQPPRCTTMTADVCGVIAASMVSGVMLPVSGSMSAKTGRSPTATIADAVAMNVWGVVITSDPGGRSSARSASSRASVPFATNTAWFSPVKSANSRSNSRPSAPVQ